MTPRFAAFLPALIAPLLLLSSPAAAEWRRAESPNFIVYADGSEARLRERILLLEDFHRLLSSVTGVETPPARNKLNVYILDDAGDLREVRGNLPSGVGGVYLATPAGVATYVSAAATLSNAVLFHEYAHHFMLQFAPGAYPVWFREGFAEYFMTARLGAEEIEFGDVPEWRIRALGNSRWLPMDRVLSGGLRGLSGPDFSRFYAQSWLATHYFYSNAERFAQLRRYLGAVAAGTDPATALQEATGLTPTAFQRTLADHIRGGRIVYRRMPRATGTAIPAIAITTLPASANELMFARAALHVGQRDDFGQRLLARVRPVATRHGNDRFARRVLAQAEAMHGDGAAADRLLDGLLAETPNDVELLYWRGMRHLRAAERGEAAATNAREAARWFGRAFRADENHYQTLYRFAQSQHGQPDYVGENNRNILVLAHSLAPQVAEIRMAAASVLLSRREYGLAESLLQPLAADPHNDRLAQAARELIDRARAGQAGTPPSTGQ